MSEQNDFQKWIDKQLTPEWDMLPLTHITRSVFAHNILEEGRLDPVPCDNFDKNPLVYFFYGRPAYRANQDTIIQLEASCPCCFIFDPVLLKRANKVHAFDTGAFFARLYNHVLDDGFKVSDFEIGRDSERLLRLISAAFNSQDSYFDADKSKLVDVEKGAEPWELAARSYLSLLQSPGRNEPDDRICTIEAVFSDPVLLDSDLKSIIVPHTFWTPEKQSPFLIPHAKNGVEIRTYRFMPGRHPEFYQAHLEAEILRLYQEWGLL